MSIQGSNFPKTRRKKGLYNLIWMSYLGIQISKLNLSRVMNQLTRKEAGLAPVIQSLTRATDNKSSWRRTQKQQQWEGLDSWWGFDQSEIIRGDQNKGKEPEEWGGENVVSFLPTGSKFGKTQWAETVDPKNL